MKNAAAGLQSNDNTDNNKKEYKKILIVAFSGVEQYPEDQIKAIKEKNPGAQFKIVSPFEVIHRKTVNEWATQEKLKRHLVKCGIEETKILTHNYEESFKIKVKAILCALSFKKSLKLIMAGQCVPVYINGTESSGYVLDGLQRWVRAFKIEKENSLSNQVSYTLYIYRVIMCADWLCNLLLENKPDEVIINHNTYFESGWVAAFLSENYKTKVVHVQKIQTDVVLTNPRQRWFENEVEKKMEKEKFDGTEINEALPWYDRYSLNDYENLRDLPLNPKKVLVVMHAFSDANHIQWREDVLFQSYYHWVKYTLLVAKENQSIDYIFRVHPNTNKYYQKDKETIKSLFKRSPENVTLEYPGENDVNHFFGEIPVVVTCSGSIALEMAIAGICVVATGRPHAPRAGHIYPNSRSEYRELISGKISPNSIYLDDTVMLHSMLYKLTLNKLVKRV